MCLSGKGRGGRNTGRLREARGCGGKAHVAFREMQFPSVVPSSIVVPVTLGGVGGWDGELGVDLVEGVLGLRKAELVLEERGFGGISIGAGQIEALGRIDELLGLLDDVGEVGEHGP